MFAAAAATGILSLYGTPALADSFAGGGAEDSPGVLSGNNVQVPVHVPVNACGNTATAVGAFNGAYDNTCVNDSTGHGGAHADGRAKGSPGVLSGNNVQAPVHVPVNACGNSINGAAAFNEASGNTCANVSGDHAHKDADRSYDAHGSHAHDTSHESSHAAPGGAHAMGAAVGSPGVLSGNVVQVPVDVPLNVCGNSVNVLALLNSTESNTCVNESGPGKVDEPEKEKPEPPAEKPPVDVQTPPPHGAEKPPTGMEEPGRSPHLAETGSDGMIAASAAGAVLITGGAMLYRRSRMARR